ncbi:MAG: protoheme IX farnesyltransferase [Lysobacterales bacterium]|nr:MAG: protoheme IX farnesyltransferase [Xanthomonadales bacterium]
MRHSATLGQYYQLTKPKVVALIVFTAVVGMFLATPALPPPGVLLWGTLGIALAAASAAAFNQLLDQRIDALMARTQHRPLPSGQLKPEQVVPFASFLAAASMFVLTVFVNWLTAALTFASIIGYALIYTVYLKRATPQNIVIGGAAGAAPPVLGWTAVTGTLDPLSLLLFLIIFIWTPPHFWALALYRKEDYAAAGIPMLPVTHGERYTRLQILLYSLLLLAASVLPWALRMSGNFYLGGALVLGFAFLYFALRLFRSGDPLHALELFRYSVVYLFALFAFLLADHYLSPRSAAWIIAFEPIPRGD